MKNNPSEVLPMRKLVKLSKWSIALLLLISNLPRAQGQEGEISSAVRKSSERLAVAFNAARADEIASSFLPNGELIDEQGTVYQGTEEIKSLLGAFFERFPGTKLSLSIESIRPAGPIAIEEGTRALTSADGSARAEFQYIAVWAKSDRGWQLASFRDIPNDPESTPNENLQSLAWLVGEWVNEGADARVKIAYRWTEDKNFIIGDFEVTDVDGNTMKSNQRIAWDAHFGCARSWFFDSDGGFTVGTWTETDEGWLVNNSATLPNGATGSATLKILPGDNGRFVISGMHRVVDGQLEDDFEITVVKRAPAPGQ